MGTKKTAKQKTRTRKPPNLEVTLQVHTYTGPPTKAWNDLWSRILKEMAAEFDGEQPHTAYEAGARE
ncbi:MAG: hypothetical protein F4Z08_02375 [Chloroflexi bacterium]|nr:hypothetical protein [Chloroflexota bacterium]